MHQTNPFNHNINPNDQQTYKLLKIQQKYASNQIILTPLQYKNKQKRQQLKTQLKTRIQSLCPQKRIKLIKKCHFTDSPEIYQYLHQYQVQVSKKLLTFYNVWMPLNVDDFTSIYWKNVEVLKLIGCQINDIGWVTIIRYSYMFPHVKVIHIEKNRITDLRLKFVLKTLTPLKLLFIGHITTKQNYLTKSCIQQLTEYQKTKQTNKLKIQYSYFPRIIALTEQRNRLKRQQQNNNQSQITNGISQSFIKQPIQKNQQLMILQKYQTNQNIKKQLQIKNQSPMTFIFQNQCSFTEKNAESKYCPINQNNQKTITLLEYIEKSKQKQPTFEAIKQIQIYKNLGSDQPQQKISINIDRNFNQNQKILPNLEENNLKSQQNLEENNLKQQQNNLIMNKQ